jgi:hypothetical protein
MTDSLPHRHLVPRALKVVCALFGQPGFPQSLGELGEMVRAADRDHFAEVGNAKGGIEPAHVRHRLLGFRQLPGKRILLVQYRGVVGGDTDQFKQAGKAVILHPARFKSGELQVPFEPARH